MFVFVKSFSEFWQKNFEVGCGIASIKLTKAARGGIIALKTDRRHFLPAQITKKRIYNEFL